MPIANQPEAPRARDDSRAAPLPGPAGAWEASLGGTRLHFGAGALSRIGAVAGGLGGRHVLVVTDPGVRAAGHADRAERSIREAGLSATLFDAVVENPTTRHVVTGTEAARAAGIDLIAAVGGGSAMDTARGINFLLTNGGRMEQYRGFNRASRPMLPSIGAPTTAGTGSEAQSFALIEHEETLEKMACGDEKARFRAVLLDPELTATMPRGVAGRSAMDAISHVVESYVCTRANPLSRLFGRAAWEQLTGGFDGAVASEASDAEARGRMLLGAFLAGAAVEASMLGAAHACANPLTSRHALPHGLAVLLTLPHVVRYNRPAAGDLYRELSGDDGLDLRLESLRARAGLPARLRDCGVPKEAIPALAREAAGQWTAGFNPIPVAEADLRSFYDAAW